MDELLAQFLIEGPELVQQGSEALMALEDQPGDRALIDDAFRAIHTLKGSVGLFDLPAMGAALHAAEDALGAVRDAQRPLDADLIDSLLAILIQTERWLDALAGAGVLPADAAALSDRLAARLDGVVVEDAAPPGLSGMLPPWAANLARRGPLASEPLVAIRYSPDRECFFRGDDPMAVVAALPGLAFLSLALAQNEDDGPYDPFVCRLIIEALSSASLEEATAAFRFAPDQVSFALVAGETQLQKTPRPRPAETQARTLRVEAERIDALATLVDELATAKTGLGNIAALAQAQGASGPQARALADSLAVQYSAIDRLVGITHQRVMALRITPLGPLLRRFPRVVRDMAAGLDKSVELVVEDGGVEADKGVVEGLFEPLTHLLRNAVDHGVEARDQRAALGKSEKALITLSAQENAGRLIIRLRDDGRGVNPATIRAKVAERGLMDADRLERLSDDEMVELIFLPGLSTAEAVTPLSGRGVGMDAVRAAIHRLGGRIAAASTPGAGVTIELNLPLALTQTKVLVVTSGDERYGVPMDRILETLRVPTERIIPIRAGHAFNWRDATVPLLRLSSLVGGTRISDEYTDPRVLVVRIGEQTVGLATDAIEDRLDVTVRPLDGLLAGMPGVTGASLLGDGRVLMILDVEALVG